MKTREVKHHDFSDKSVRIRLKESLFENINYLIIPFFLGYEEIGKNYYNELQFYDFYMINYTISGNARFTVNNLTLYFYIRIKSGFSYPKDRGTFTVCT